ncbi:hypothetical protein CJ030_MR1G027790 [Morella rubra]|uniref:Uncharacterized protein n=1 Tax=Morella rubra TaxID=262757 RepID=A0A6A1WLS2_9ROSI|nr:hypothetical protein CJ030_MR1G027790 [Morella rubra]
MAVAAAYGVDAPPEELQEIINQVAMNIHGLYVLKSSPEHPEYDPLRRVVIDLLRAKPRDAMLKKADVFQAAKMVLKRDITNNEYSYEEKQAIRYEDAQACATCAFQVLVLSYEIYDDTGALHPLPIPCVKML